jgi:hypothetical protein
MRRGEEGDPEAAFALISKTDKKVSGQKVLVAQRGAESRRRNGLGPKKKHIRSMVSTLPSGGCNLPLRRWMYPLPPELVSKRSFWESLSIPSFFFLQTRYAVESRSSSSATIDACALHIIRRMVPDTEWRHRRHWTVYPASHLGTRVPRKEAVAYVACSVNDKTVQIR